MKCPEVRLHMEEYRRGILSARVADRIERHIEHCGDCADHFAKERRFSAVLERVFLPDESFETGADRMWGGVMARIRAQEVESDSVSPAFFRRAMAYSCASILFIFILALYFGRERLPAAGPAATSTPCFRVVIPRSDSPYEKETLNLLDPGVYSVEQMRSFLSEMKRPARADFFTECYPQLEAIHAQSGDR